MGLVIGLALIALSAWMLWRILRPVPAVWGGDVRSVPLMGRLQPQARTYLTYILATTPAFLGVLLLGVMIAIANVVVAAGWSEISPTPIVAIGAVALGMVWLAIPMAAIHIFVGMFAWPKVLIAPPYRDLPGAVSRWRAARKAHRGRGASNASSPM